MKRCNSLTSALASQMSSFPSNKCESCLASCLMMSKGGPLHWVVKWEIIIDVFFDLRRIQLYWKFIIQTLWCILGRRDEYRFHIPINIFCPASRNFGCRRHRTFFLCTQFTQGMSVSKDEGLLTIVLIMLSIINYSWRLSLSHSLKYKTGWHTATPIKSVSQMRGLCTLQCSIDVDLAGLA